MKNRLILRFLAVAFLLGATVHTQTGIISWTKAKAQAIKAWVADKAEKTKKWTIDNHAILKISGVVLATISSGLLYRAYCRGQQEAYFNLIDGAMEKLKNGTVTAEFVDTFRQESLKYGNYGGKFQSPDDESLNMQIYRKLLEAVTK